MRLCAHTHFLCFYLKTASNFAWFLCRINLLFPGRICSDGNNKCGEKMGRKRFLSEYFQSAFEILMVGSSRQMNS